jgi:hypothetical protein
VRAVAAARRWQRARRLSAPGTTRERGRPGGIRACEGAASRAQRRRRQPGRDRGRPPGWSWARERAQAQAHDRDRDRTVALGRAAGEIGQLLRHRSQQTTAIYAKVDPRAAQSARPAVAIAGGCLVSPLEDQLATTCGSAGRSATNSRAPRSSCSSSSRSWKARRALDHDREPDLGDSETGRWSDQPDRKTARPPVTARRGPR